MPNKYEQIIRLDVSHKGSYNCVYAKQGDKRSRYLKIELLNGDIKLTPKQSDKAILRCVKPDGKCCYNNGSINTDGTVSVELTEQVLAVNGVVQADLSLQDDDSVLSTATFYIDVDKLPLSPNQVVSNNEFLALVAATKAAKDATDKVDVAINNCNAATSAASTASINAANATKAANTAAETANAAAETINDALSEKEDTSNKTNTITLGRPSSTLYPTEEAVVFYTNSKFLDAEFVISEIPSDHATLDNGDILTAKAILNYVDSKGAAPTYAASVDEMTDTNRMYIGSNGHLWAYRPAGASYTNQLPISTDKTGAVYNGIGYKTGSYLSVEGADGSGTDSNAICTGFIPYSAADSVCPVIRIKGCTVDTSASHTRIYLYANSDNYAQPVVTCNGANILNYFTTATSDDGVTTLTPKDTLDQSTGINYLRMSVVDSSAVATDIILTVGEEISTGTGYAWQDTGVAYTSGNYDAEIADLKSASTQAQADISDLDGRLADVESDIKQVPDYWAMAIDTAVATARAKQNLGGVNAVSFVWLSDMHIHNSDTDSIPYETNIGAVANDVMDKLNINYIVHSGDTTSQAATIGGVATTLSSLYDDVAKRDDILAPIGKQRLISALGNHDGMYGYVNSTSWVYAMTWQETYNLLFRSQALDANRRFAPQGTYYYVDVPSQNFRYIVLNSQWAQYTVTDGTPSFNRFNSSYYGQEQITWLATEALNMPAGYTAAIIVHCAPNGNDERYGKDYQLVANVIKAYHDKSTYNGSYSNGTETWQNSTITVDYTSAVGTVCAVFAGHQHLDRIQSDNPLTGCPIINITAAKNYDYSSNPPTRTTSTPTETAMDIVTVDTSARKIYLTRLGVGADRQVSY